MQHTRMSGLPAAQAGFNMLEVMISILVIAFGLLSLAGLQATSLRNNHSAYLRTLATQHATDLADRIRANRGIDYSGIAIPASPLNCSAGCTPSDIAANDLFEWTTAVAATLPLPAGTLPTLTRDSTTGIYTITIAWDDDRSGTASTTFTTSFKP